MPNIKSAIKRVEVTKTKNLRNRRVKSALKTLAKKYNALVEEKDAAAVEKALRVNSGAIDRAAAKGIIHKNAANRKKAQLARALASVKMA